MFKQKETEFFESKMSQFETKKPLRSHLCEVCSDQVKPLYDFTSEKITLPPIGLDDYRHTYPQI